MDKKSPKKKNIDPDAQTCAHCLSVLGRAGATILMCARCGLVAYCSKDCQRAHWRANHKSFCVPKADRAPPPVEPKASVKKKDKSTTPQGSEGDECSICLEPLSLASAATLPCGHMFHPACVEGLRSFGVKQVCPMCRTELPPGPDQLFDVAARLFFPIQTRKERKGGSWGALTVKEQKQTDEALQLWTQAADQGHSLAQYNLGTIYERGRSVPPSDKEAIKWFQKAADQGHVDAQFNLGVMYEKGRSVPQSYEKAAQWLKKASDQGYAAAQYNLGCMCEQGRGVPQSDKEAVKWWQKAANQGYVRANCNLGFMYRNGQGVTQNFNEAVKRYRKAADQGDAEAQSSLGFMFVAGRGVPRSDKEGFKWYQKAADQGNTGGAQRSLGFMYKQGKGVHQSDKEACKWWRKAAEQGDDQAKKTLEQFRLKHQQNTFVAAPILPSPPALCEWCGINAPNLKACSRCKAKFYCSKKCQVDHWKEGHKDDCTAGHTGSVRI
jgi:TPR repeat protein